MSENRSREGEGGSRSRHVRARTDPIARINLLIQFHPSIHPTAVSPVFLFQNSQLFFFLHFIILLFLLSASFRGHLLLQVLVLLQRKVSWSHLSVSLFSLLLPPSPPSQSHSSLSLSPPPPSDLLIRRACSEP